MQLLIWDSTPKEDNDPLKRSKYMRIFRSLMGDAFSILHSVQFCMTEYHKTVQHRVWCDGELKNLPWAKVRNHLVSKFYL